MYTGIKKRKNDRRQTCYGLPFCKKGDCMNNSMDSYILEKNGFEKDNADLLLNETLFHNANGYQGVRGNFEEGYPEGYDTIRGQYINGFYNSYKINTEEW